MALCVEGARLVIPPLTSFLPRSAPQGQWRVSPPCEPCRAEGEWRRVAIEGANV